MNLIYFVNFQDVLETLNDIYTIWRRLHENRHAVSEYWDCCEDANYCEDKCANWISYVCLWVEEDD